MKPIKYFEVTHNAYCSDECVGHTSGSYGVYSTYEKAKARFDEIVKHELETAKDYEMYIKVEGDTCVVGEYDEWADQPGDGWQISIEKKTFELDVDDKSYGV